MLNKGVSTPSKKSVGKILTTFWQTGRSMVEILCVLGVIGVLSLVSFVAIRSGLAKAQVNKIAYTVNLQANALLMALEADKLPIDENGDVTLSYNKTENGFALTGFSNDDGTFGLTVHGIPKDVCQQAGQNIPEQVFGMIINAEDEENQIPVGGQVKVGGVCVDTENTLTYYFAQLSVDPAEALSDYLCAELDEECGQCQTCQNGQCVLVPAGTTDPSGTCPETKPLCSATGTCICSNEHKSCGEGKVCDAANNTCKDCPSGSTTKTLASDLCDACGNTFRKGSTCYSCDYPTSPIVGSSTEAKNLCNACPSRFWWSYSAGNEQCILNRCPTSEGTSNGSRTFCGTCAEKTGIAAFGSGNTCYACDYSSSVIVGSSTEAKNLCNACPNRQWRSYGAGNEQCILK